MHGHQLSKKDQDKLADALQHRALQLCPDASLAVPVTAVLWMGAANDTVAEHQQVESHRQSGFCSYSLHVLLQAMSHSWQASCY